MGYRQYTSLLGWNLPPTWVGYRLYTNLQGWDTSNNLQGWDTSNDNLQGWDTGSVLIPRGGIPALKNQKGGSTNLYGVGYRQYTDPQGQDTGGLSTYRCEILVVQQPTRLGYRQCTNLQGRGTGSTPTYKARILQ